MTDEAHGQSTRADLLPCPFCDGSDLHLFGCPSSGGVHVSCVSCGLEAPTETGVTEKQAVEYWNTRPSLPAPGREEIARIIDGTAFRPVHISGDGLSETEKEKWLRARNVAYYKADAILALSRPPENVDHRATEPAALRSAGVSVTREAVEKAVQHLLYNDLRERDYPVYVTDDDRGLEESEYVDFAMDLLAGLRTPGDDDSARLRSAGQSVNAIDLLDLAEILQAGCTDLSMDERNDAAKWLRQFAGTLRSPVDSDKWQDIATAPKDGTDILVVNQLRLVRIAFWDTARDGIWSIWPGRERTYPTHWQPLPAPPCRIPAESESGK